MERLCRYCGHLKSLGQFRRNNKSNDGYGHKCEECHKTVSRPSGRGTNYKITLSRRVKRNLGERYCSSCRQGLDPSEFDGDSKLCRQCRVSNKAAQVAKFGLSLATFDEWRESQRFSCAICGMHEEDLGQYLSIDHCHVTEDVRGLLCRQCNLGLGSFRDDPDTLEAAARYLRFGGIQARPLLEMEQLLRSS